MVARLVQSWPGLFPFADLRRAPVAVRSAIEPAVASQAVVGPVLSPCSPQDFWRCMCIPTPERARRSGNISDLAFGKIVAKCSSFIIACQGYDVTRRDGGASCLGDLTQEQMTARQTHLLPEPVRKSIAFLRIWARCPLAPHPRRDCNRN